MPSTQMIVRLSKAMSYLLRHRPEEGNLVLDEAGLVPLDALVRALNKRSGLGWVTEADVRHVVATSDKQRFRLVGERIGARYGHNRAVAAVDPGPVIAPPAVLFHGTPRRAVAAILREGLRPQGRQFVHLSAAPDTAQMVGERRDDRPAILRVHAQAAHAAGIPFYAPTAAIWLAPHIPPAFLEESEREG